MKTSFGKCFVLPFLLLNGLSTDLRGGKIPLSNIYIYFFDLAPIISRSGCFPGVAETIVDYVLCCGLGIVPCLFHPLYNVIL